jgi:glycosyltransferase involved in cell wall biosynthesis
MKKVLFIIPTLNAGGIETYLLRFLRLELGQFKSVVLVRSLKAGVLEEPYRSLGIEIVRMPMGYFSLSRFYGFYKFLAVEKFDVVCDFNANFSGLTILIAWLAGLKKRISFYRQASDHYRPDFFKSIYNGVLNRIVYHLATDILSNSKSALTFFFKKKWRGDARFRVILNGVQLASGISKPEIRPENAFVIGHSGRLDRTKNHAVMLRILQRLIAADLSYHLILVGEGTEQLEEECKRLKIEKHVHLLGYRSDVHDIMKGFDCFLFPSKTEGQPNALIEAWLLKIPTIVSRIEPILEILPTELLPFSKDSYDVNGFCELIVKVKGKNMGYDADSVERYAVTEFDHRKRFNEFLSVLIAPR